MPANIALDPATGEGSFFSAREVPWHRLGTVTPDALTATDALKTAHLDFDVVKSDQTVLAVLNDGSTRPVDGKYATYRTDTGAPFGIVGSKYRIVQNRDAFTLLDNIVDESGAHFETAGALGDGERVFMSMKLPEGVTIGGVDRHDVYLLAWNSHDGSTSLGLDVTPVRVVCANTLAMAIRSSERSIRIRHTSSAGERIQVAREALGITFKGLDEFKALGEQMVSAKMSTAEFKGFLDTLLPWDDSMPAGRERTLLESRRDGISALWTADTQKSVADTRWAAWNAVTEYADWYLPVRGGDDKDTLRAVRQIEHGGASDLLKSKALDLLAA